MPVVRTPWNNFPPVAIHATLSDVKAHPGYYAASLGDMPAARQLIHALIRPDCAVPRSDFVVPVVRISPHGDFNALSVALAERLAEISGAKVVPHIVQDNILPDTSSTSSIHRIISQPSFSGPVPKGTYLIASESVTLGSAIANLRGHIETTGSKVLSATSLYAAIFAAKITPDSSVISMLQRRFGNELSPTLHATAGFSPSCLTNKEANFINGLSNLISLRNPLAPTHRSIRPSI